MTKRASITYGSVFSQAKEAAEFREIRQEQGLPLATLRQINEYRKSLGGRRHTPLDLEMGALHVPLSKLERRAYENSEAAEGFKYADHQIRGRDEHCIAEVPTHIVEQMIKDNDCKTHEDVIMTVCRMFSFVPAYLSHAMKRVERWANSNSDRMPEHIRQKALMLSAIAQGCQMEGIKAA